MMLLLFTLVHVHVPEHKLTLLLGRNMASPRSILASSISASLNEALRNAGCTITRLMYPIQEREAKITLGNCLCTSNQIATARLMGYYYTILQSMYHKTLEKLYIIALPCIHVHVQYIITMYNAHM